MRTRGLRKYGDHELAVGMTVMIREETWEIREILDTENGRLVLVVAPTPANAFYETLRYDCWPRYLTELDPVYAPQGAAA